MRLYARLSVLILGVAALLIAPKSSAQIVSISPGTPNQCGRGLVICSGQQAYSLSEIESGALQIPIFPILPSEIVVVNDTGAPITQLEFTATTLQILGSFAQCQIDSTMKSYLSKCTTSVVSSGSSNNPFASVTVQFSFTAGTEGGIPNGAYFDMTTLGFIPGSYLAAPVSTGSGGDGVNPGTGTASY